jgi:hypothetical protein
MCLLWAEVRRRGYSHNRLAVSKTGGGTSRCQGGEDNSCRGQGDGSPRTPLETKEVFKKPGL